jgi:hypothetical protein
LKKKKKNKYAMRSTKQRSGLLSIHTRSCM